MERLMNKTFEEIMTAYNERINRDDDIREMIRMYLSRLLMNTSEENKFVCEFPLDTHECCGLSSLQMPWVTAMWQDPAEGFITFIIDEKSKRDFDDMDIEELISVVKGVN